MRRPVYIFEDSDHHCRSTSSFDNGHERKEAMLSSQQIRPFLDEKGASRLGRGCFLVSGFRNLFLLLSHTLSRTGLEF